MKVANFALTTAVATARYNSLTRGLEGSNNVPMSIVQHDFIEVETIGYNGYNIGMTIYIGATDFMFSDSTSTDVVVRFEFYDVLLGDLIDGSYY